MVAMCSFQNSKLASAVGYLPIGNLSANFKGMQVLLSSCIFERKLPPSDLGRRGIFRGHCHPSCKVLNFVLPTV